VRSDDFPEAFMLFLEAIRAKLESFILTLAFFVLHIFVLYISYGT
jgi:hypothetical protein